MFFPKEMTEIQMVVPSEDLVTVTKSISDQGIFQTADSSYMTLQNENKSTDGWQEKVSGYATLEHRIQMLMQLVHMEEAAPSNAEFNSFIDLKTAQKNFEEMDQEVKKTSDQLVGSGKKLEEMKSTIEQLDPFSELEIDINLLRSPRFLFSILGVIPNDNIERLQTSLERIPFVFLVLRQDKQKSIVWLGGSQNNSENLVRASRSAYLNPVSLPEGYHGTPTEIIQLLNSEIKETKQKQSELEQALSKFRDHYQAQLQALLWEVRMSRMYADAIVHFGHLHYTYLIVGWIPTRSLDSFTRTIKKVSVNAILDSYPVKRSSPDPSVPVGLNNPKLISSFQMLVTTYGRPRYNEIDPTWMMTFLFPLLYGAMFGDAGQGLILTLLGWLLTSRKVKALKSLAGLGGLITACGLSATLFGFLYGSVFGFENVLKPIWISPVNNILMILEIAIAGGVILLSLGFLLGIYNAWAAREWGDLFFDNHGLAGLLLYWSLLGAGASLLLLHNPVITTIAIIIAFTSGMAVMFSDFLKNLVGGHRPLIEGGLGAYLFQAFFQLFETVVSFLSNSLSWVRVGAFAVAHGGLSAAFFILAELASPVKGVGYWFVLLLGNIFIVGFEGLIVGIQTMRLSYYEFFGKFFHGGGLKYEPLSLRTDESKLP